MANYGPVCPSSRLLNIIIRSLITASADDTVQAVHDPPLDEKSGTRSMPALTHPTAVRAVLPLLITPLAEPYILTGSGDIIRAYDISSPDEPELLGETDGHWHDVTALRLWMRKSAVEGESGKYKIEPWVVSTSLDGTLRKWKLLGASRGVLCCLASFTDSVSQTFCTLPSQWWIRKKLLLHQLRRNKRRSVG